jgi:ABC-2 type transport system permease protein
VNGLRVFFSCGVTSCRALFGWVNPYVFVPILVVYPIAQILFFAYLGRSAGVESDAFFLIGNTFCAASVAAMFGMGQAIGGERRFQTLPLLMASPVNRLVMYTGRALPTVLIGFLVAAIAFVCGAAILDVHVGRDEALALALALLASCCPCAGLGLCIGSLGLRGRSVGLFADVMAGGLLIVSGANVPLERLPDAVQSLSSIVPPTHGIEAARSVAERAPA